MPARRKLVLSPKNGTRFKVYVQSPVIAAFSAPETVTVSVPPAKIGPGPSDARIIVRRPLMKPPYPCAHPQAFVAGDGREWRGAVAPAVTAGPDGHFDHLAQDSSEFAAAAVYGTLRADLERRGMRLDDPDLRVASIALARDLTLVTGNVRHFERVPGLRVENWLDVG